MVLKFFNCLKKKKDKENQNFREYGNIIFFLLSLYICVHVKRMKNAGDIYTDSLFFQFKKWK